MDNEPPSQRAGRDRPHSTRTGARSLFHAPWTQGKHSSNAVVFSAASSKEQGSGKGTMIFDSMSACNADGVSMCDAHPDLEVFRLRLGKAINFEFNEDSQTGLFQRRDPREGGPALDIERGSSLISNISLIYV